MEKENEGNVYTKIISLFTRHPEATVTIVTIFAFGIIGVIIYLAPQFGKGQNTNTSNSLKFDIPSGSPQNQGAVEGANTQNYGPEEQPSNMPSSAPISATPTSSDSATPTQTPTPTSSPTSVPTSTPGPTSTPAPTQTPTPVVTSTPTPTPTDTSPSPTSS